MLDIVATALTKYPLITAFVIVGIIMWASYKVAKLTNNRIHGSAIAIVGGLILAYIGGVTTGGKHGIADIQLFAGFGLMGGGMLRDFAIVSTAFGVKMEELKKAGLPGVLALVVSMFLSVVIGAAVAYAFGYTSPGRHGHHRRWRGDLHRRPGHRCGSRRFLGSDRPFRRRRRREVDLGDDPDAVPGQDGRPRQPGGSRGLWRA